MRVRVKGEDGTGDLDEVLCTTSPGKRLDMRADYKRSTSRDEKRNTTILSGGSW